MLKLLWLCSWYPDQVIPDNGDFIQRHAQAASLYHHIHVIKVTPDAQASGVSMEQHTDPHYPRLREQRIYYPWKEGRIGQLVSFYRWWKLYQHAISEYILVNGKPDLVHVHIPFKAGLIALWLRKRYRLPFVVTEHWGGYNTVVAGNYTTKGFLFKWITRKTFAKAAGFHTVSKYLGEQVNRYIGPRTYTVIPNVVDTSLFHLGDRSTKSGSKCRLLHISNGAEVKNLPGVIAAFQLLDPEKFSLEIVGLREADNRRFSEAHPEITFTGIQPYRQVAVILQQCDILLLFSHMENSPCVIGEAFCCGKPVIAPRVGGIPELGDAAKSILIAPGDIVALKEAIETMEATYTNFDSSQMAAQAAARFSYETIGLSLDQWYRSRLQEKVNS